ncbi:hypothetical protein AB0368_35745 [Actinoplanes sp. NPDC051475]|uniref:hypothetical protein n=1 Tax=Actinoplanes sp. NPDC051475 TaxID=3157225 RepID=UPI00344D6C82
MPGNPFADFFSYTRSDGTRVARSRLDDTVALGSVAASTGSFVADGLKNQWDPGRAADAKSAASWGQALAGLYEVSAAAYRGYRGLENLREHKINNLAKLLTASAGVVKAVTDGYTDAEKEANPRIKLAESIANYAAAVGVAIDLASRVNTQRQEKRREHVSSRQGSVHDDPVAAADSTVASLHPAAEAAAAEGRRMSRAGSPEPPANRTASAASLPHGSQPAAAEATVVPLRLRQSTASTRTTAPGR